MKSLLADPDADLLARARAIHARVLTVDTHVDIPPDFGTESYDPRGAKRGRGQIDLVGMEHGGLDAVFFIVYVGQGERNAAGYARAMADAFAKFAAIRRMTDVQYPEAISLARSAADVRRIHREGRLAALIGIENGHALGATCGFWTRTTTSARATWACCTTATTTSATRPCPTRVSRTRPPSMAA